MPAMIAASMPMPLMTRKWWVCGPSPPSATVSARLADSASCVRLGLDRPDAQLADVDAAVAARQRDGEGRLEADRQVEVAREQVAGARGQDAERHLRADEHARDVAHGAVAAERAHDVDALAHGGRRLAGAGVVGGRLEIDRLAPAVRAAGRVIRSRTGRRSANFVGLMMMAARRTGASCSSPERKWPRWGRGRRRRSGAVTSGATRFMTKPPMTNASTTIPATIHGR